MGGPLGEAWVFEVIILDFVVPLPGAVVASLNPVEWEAEGHQVATSSHLPKLIRG